MRNCPASAFLVRTMEAYHKRKEAEAVLRKGYLYVQREWKCGDCLELELDMGIRFWESNPRVIDTSGRIAVTRGPLVFCAEGIDNEDLLLRDVRIKPMQEGEICFRQMEGTTLPGAGTGR